MSRSRGRLQCRRGYGVVASTEAVVALLPWTSPRVEHVPTTVGNLVERLRGLGGGFRGRGRRKTVWIVTVDRGRGRFRATGRRCARGCCAAEDVFFFVDERARQQWGRGSQKSAKPPLSTRLRARPLWPPPRDGSEAASVGKAVGWLHGCCRCRGREDVSAVDKTARQPRGSPPQTTPGAALGPILLARPW